MFIFLSISMYYLVNIPIGRLYMHHMSNGAKLNGMTIELCTPYLRHTLSALEMPPVTFVSTQFRNTPADLGFFQQSLLYMAVKKNHSKLFL